MRGSVLPAVLVVGLLAASALGAAAPGQGRGNGPGRVPAPIGSFLVEGSTQQVTGEHLSFHYSDAGVTDLRAANRTLFDVAVAGVATQIEDDEGGEVEEGARVEGGRLRVRTANFTLVAHDNPSAPTMIRTDGQITVTFEDGVVIMRATEEAVRFSFGDVTGVLRGDDLTVMGRTVTAGDELLAFLDVARGSFDKNREKIGGAIARGHVGAEATFNAIDDDVEQEVVSYGNVTMTTVRAERGNLTLLVEGHGFEGRVLVLNVDGRFIGADASEKLNILLDNASIERASDLTDILDPDDDGFAPEYYVVHDPVAEAFQLIVTVPHYSVHTLSVTLVELLKPSVVIGVLAGVALLVPAALLLFRRK